MKKLNKSICPICGEDNNCMAHSNEPCWCNNIEIPEELLDISPNQKACICLKCIQDFKEDPVRFISKRILHNS